MNDNAQTPLDRLLSICYTSTFSTNTVKNRSLVYRSYSVDRRRWHKQTSGLWSVLSIPASSVRWQNFF